MDKKTIEKICKINELLSGLSTDVHLVAIDKENEEYQFNSILMDGDVIYLGDFCHIDEFHWSIYLEDVVSIVFKKCGELIRVDVL